MDTERRMTTQEMLTQHKKLMDEAQRLEPSVMVTERNWNAMLKMQHNLFQQQMQLDTDLKKLLTREDAQESLIKMQTSAEKFEKQAGSLNEKYSSGCKTLTESTKNALTTILNDTKNQLSDMEQTAQKKIITCAWISTAAVILCTAKAQMTDDAPTRDGTTIALHIDSKRRKKLRQKKTALGHAEDDHEDWTMEQHL